MKTNQAGIAIIQKREGLELSSYPDPASVLGNECTKNNLKMIHYTKIPGWQALSGTPWTIGYGHTGPEITPGMLITSDRAVELFLQDVADKEQGILRLLNNLGVVLNENQFSALVSLVYNIGVPRFSKSCILQAIDNDDYALAVEGFLKYIYSKGVKIQGLVNRRQEEQKLFLTSVS